MSLIARRKKWIVLCVGLALLIGVLVLVLGDSAEPQVLAGRMSYSMGNDHSWIDPSSVLARRGHVLPIEVFNHMGYTRTFQIEKVAPYDSEIVDACESVEIDTDSLVLGGRERGVFNIRVIGHQEGEAWIRVTPEGEGGTVNQAWIVRIRIDS